MKKSEVISYLFLRTIGNFLVLFALFGVVATFGPAIYYEVSFRVQTLRGIHYEVASFSYDSFLRGSFSHFASEPNTQLLIPKDTNFSILIPKIGADAKVIANVDVSDENVYLQALTKGVAHAKGTVFPGMKGNIYLFAHSTDNFWDVGRYNALFYLLKDMSIGDSIVIFFENVRHDYIVTQTKILDPSDVSLLVNAKTGIEQLILQTCWPPGTAFKRFIVFARPK